MRLVTTGVGRDTGSELTAGYRIDETFDVGVPATQVFQHGHVLTHDLVGDRGPTPEGHLPRMSTAWAAVMSS